MRTRTPNRDFNGFNDPLAKILGGVGILLTLMLCTVTFLAALVDVAYLEMLQPVMWLLGAYGIVGAICGKASRNRSA